MPVFRFHTRYWILLIVLLLICCLVAGQQSNPNGKFYGGMVLGAGWLQLSRNEVAGARTARFGLSLYGGYRPLPWLRTGISLGGWTIEPYNYYYDYYYENEPVKGISISNVFGQVQVFPIEQADIYINLEYGWSKYINMHADEFDAKGTGGKVGIGYERKLGRKMALNISANYARGSFKDVRYTGIEITNQHYNVMEIMLGITLR